MPELSKLLSKDIVGLKIISTYKCNKRCKFCYQSTFNSIDLNLEILAKKLLEIKSSFYPVFITFQGGEHTVLKDWVKHIQITSKIFPHSRISITTNGSANLEDYAKAIDLGLSNISFSINEADHTILDKAAFLSRRGDVTVRFNTVLDYDNLDFLKEIFELAKNNRINFNICSNVLEEDPAAFDTIMELIKPDTFDKPISHVTRFYKDGYQFWLHHYAPEGYNQIYILPNGNFEVSNQKVIEGVGAF